MVQRSSVKPSGLLAGNRATGTVPPEEDPSAPPVREDGSRADGSWERCALSPREVLMMHVWSADRREVWYGFGDWCAICWSELTRGLPDVRGPMACLTCLRIDAGLATAHGARLMTPLDPIWGRDADVLLHRLRPDDGAARERRDGHRYKGMLRRLTEANAMRDPAAPRIALRYPGSGHRVFDRERWQLLNPPGPAASARAYVRYAEEVHPWMSGVDPRVVDEGALLKI